MVGIAAVLATSACSVNVKTNSAGAGSDSIYICSDNGSPTFQANFNPFATSNKRSGSLYVYEPLAVANPLDGKETPFLASSTDVVDAKTVKFTIRQGVKWSDGKPFTANDVAYTFNLIKKTPGLDVNGEWPHISSFDVSGNTVTFNLKTDDAPAVSILSMQQIVPEHIWKDVKNPSTWLDSKPIGTGPFELDTFTPNQYTMKKNVDYWQADKVAVSKIIMPADNTELQIVKNQCDWAFGHMTDVNKTWVSTNPKTNTYWFPPLGTIGLVPNLSRAPFNNVDVRRGISYALDRTKIANDAEGGYVDAAPQTGLLPSNKDFLDTSLPDNGMISQSKKASLASFAKAGYTYAGGKLVDSSGKQLTMTITVPGSYSDWVQGMKTIKSQLTAIGIDVKLNLPQASFYQTQSAGNFDMLMSSYGGTGSIYRDFETTLDSSYIPAKGVPASGNYERYDNPKADALIAQLRATTDVGAQKKITDQLQQIMYNDVPVISMFYAGQWGIFSSKSFTGWPSAKDPYSTVAPYVSSALLVLTHLKKVS